MHRRKRSRRYRGAQKKNSKLNFAPVVLILCLSVGCGYAAAKYIVEPVVNYVPQEKTEETQQILEQTEEEAPSDGSDSEVVEGDADVKETGRIAGYALQFGCYSSKESAETATASLGLEGLQILEQNDMYKITGELYSTKEKAQQALRELPEDTKAFVTTIYEEK